MFKKTNSVITNTLPDSEFSLLVEFTPADRIPSGMFGYDVINYFSLDIDGKFNVETEETDWKVIAKFIDKEKSEAPFDLIGANNLYFEHRESSSPYTLSKIGLGVATNLEVCSYSIPENSIGIEFDSNIDEGLIDFLQSPNLDDNPSDEFLNDMEIPSANNSKSIQIGSKTVKYKLNNDTACVGLGIQMGNESPKMPYSGLFLGVRLLYDGNTNEILKIETDSDGSADWYESDYQVIVYPCEPMLCPALTVAVSVWVTYIGKKKDN